MSRYAAKKVPAPGIAPSLPQLLPSVMEAVGPVFWWLVVFCVIVLFKVGEGGDGNKSKSNVKASGGIDPVNGKASSSMWVR